MITIFETKGGLLDQALPEIFKNKTRSKPRQDSVTLEFLQDMVNKPGYCYTCTFTLDMKKPKLWKQCNDPWKQWKYIKNQLMLKLTSYKFRCVMVPEKHENGNMHGHGVLRFQQNNFYDMDVARAKLMKFMSKTCARNIQWTRINDAHQPYMPTESNKRISAPVTLKGWHKYLHKKEYRKHFGMFVTENL